MSVTSAGKRLLWVVGIAIILTFAFHGLYPWTTVTPAVESVLVCVALLATLMGETIWSFVLKRSSAPAARSTEPPGKGHGT